MPVWFDPLIHEVKTGEETKAVDSNYPSNVALAKKLLRDNGYFIIAKDRVEKLSYQTLIDTSLLSSSDIDVRQYEKDHHAHELGCSLFKNEAVVQEEYLVTFDPSTTVFLSEIWVIKPKNKKV